VSQSPSSPGSNRIGNLVRELLDRGYAQATRSTLAALAESVDSPLIKKRLAELETEAARLAEAGEPLRPDNPVLRALLADLEPALRRNAARIDAASEDLQRDAINRSGELTRQLALFGRGDRVLAEIGASWNVPDPEAVRALVGYVRSSAWRDEMERYPGAVLDAIANQAVRGIVEGWSPLRTARAIRELLPSMTVARAQNLMRTVQLTSYRDAAVLHRVANADILAYQVRIAVLDNRTCLACIALHGTRLSLNERVNDHHQGRCTSISVLRGGFERNIPDGEAWYNQQPESRQRQIAGDTIFELLKQKRARLADFVQQYRDPVFGEMVRQASVKRVLSRRR
jgi:hypothetical protein